MIKNAIFDLDGTILNTFDGVSRCIKCALKQMDKPIPSDITLRRFLGPALMDSFTKILGYTKADAEQAIKLYRALYKESGIYECSMFEGYPEIFERLKKEGVLLSVASSKPKPYIMQILNKLDISKYFERIEGPEFDADSSDKTQLVKSAMVTSNAVMIGDRYFDIIAARQAGVPSIGVTYGFFEEGEFDEYKPDFIAHNTDDIYNIIMSN